LNHHPVFSKFPPSPQPAVPGFQCDFIGSRFRCEFDGAGEFVDCDYPRLDDEYFEWISLLESVASARERFVMLELGAGYGRWSIRGACAARSLGMPFYLVAVEADPLHFGYLRTAIEDNGIRECTLIHSAVSTAKGKSAFYVRTPDGREGSAWWGQRLLRADESVLAGYDSTEIDRITLPEILAPFPAVDLIDMDIEGEELGVVRDSIDLLEERVRRLHIGTHSVEIEKGLRTLLAGRDWECLADYSLFSSAETPYGPIAFENGAQTWAKK